MSPMQIPGFEMIAKLGEGGMASVWKARQLSLDRIVAIKILSSRMASDADDVQRFQFEAQSAAKLKHLGIVQVYDAACEQGIYYFVMEYVAGYTVGQWLRRKGVLPFEDALLVADGVADALGYAWSKAGIIHCDIKPENVMIDADGTVKVADLGLARTIRTMGAQAEIADIMGTPAFISPEQAEGRQDLDCRTDIYSLGAMLYTMVTGRLLFQGHSDEAIMAMQGAASVPDPMDLNPGLPPGVCGMIETMLAKERDARPPDWNAVRRDLELVRNGRMPAARLPEGARSTVERSARRDAAISPVESGRPGHLRVRRSQLGALSASVPPGRRRRDSRLPVLLVLLAAAAATAVVADRYRRKQDQERQEIERKVWTKARHETRLHREARRRYEDARLWERSHATHVDEAVQRYKNVIADAPGTEWASRAAEDIQRLIMEARRRHADEVFAQLQQTIAAPVQNQRYGEAARVMEGYQGPMAAETAERRQAAARDLWARQKAFDREQREAVEASGRRATEMIDALAAHLLTAGLADARLRFVAALDQTDAKTRDGRLGDIRRILDEAANIDARVMDTFVQSIGQDVTVSLGAGTRTLTIQNVRDGRVYGMQKIIIGEREARTELSFGVNDLSPGERLRRMGDDDQPEVALVKGLMAYQQRATEHARKYFSKTHRALGDRLIVHMDQALSDRRPGR